MKAQIKIAIVFLAATTLLVEMIDELKGTSLYTKSRRERLKNTQKDFEKLINDFYKNLDGDSEKYYHDSVRVVEVVVEAIKNKDIDKLMMVILALNNGEIGIFDEKKHSKISKQIEKL